MEPLKDVRKLFGWNSDASISDGKFHMFASVFHSHGDCSGEGELEGIREKVEDDFLPHVAVEIHGFGERRAIDDELDAGLLDRRAEAARQVGCQGAHIGAFVSGLYAAGFDARKIEQSINQLLQPK